MSATITKGQCFTLDHTKHNLSRISIAFGWDCPQPVKGLWAHWFSDDQHDYEIDVITLLCGVNGKIRDLGWSLDGEPSFKHSDVIFFNNLKHDTGDIWLGGGGYHVDDQREDAEQVFVHLNSLNPKYTRLVFMLQIYDAIRKNHDLSHLKNAYLRISDASGQTIVKFQLEDLTEYTQQRSMVLAELCREGDQWTLQPIVQTSRSDTFIDWLQHYV